MNKIIPHRRPSSTIEVCNPWTAPSRLMSRHHWYITNAKRVKPRKKRIILFKWNKETIPEVKYRPPTAPNKGHGDSSTMWKGWHILFDNTD